MTDVAALGASVTLTGAAEADKQLLRFAASAAKAENAAAALNKPITGLRDASGKFVSANKLAAETLDKSGKSATVYGNSIEQLRSKYVPLFAATRQYEAELRDIAAAERLGAISANEAASARTRAAAGMQRMVPVTRAAGVEMQNYGGHTANVFAQLNDIGVMMASGQNPLQLALQQGTQLNQVWGQMGGKVGAIGTVLKGAFTSLLNPINLVTLAVIAGGAALVGYFTGGEEKAKSLDDTLDELWNSVSQLNEISKVYSADGLQQMIEKYGQVDAALLRMIDRQREFSENTAMEKARAAVTAVSDEYGLAINNIIRARAFADDVTNSLGLTKAQAVALRQAISDASSATTFQAQSEALGRMNAIIDVSKVRLGETAVKANEAEDAVRQLANSAPQASWMNAAISGVQGVINKIWEAVRANNALAKAQSAPGMTTGTPLFKQGFNGIGLPGSLLIPSAKESSGIGGSAGGGGGGTDPYQANLDALVKSLMTERETVEKWYADSEVLLNDKRAREQMGEASHKEAMLDLERQYQEKMKGIKDEGAATWLTDTSKLFGDLNTMAGGGYESLLKAQKGFAAAEALINTYRAAAQVLADPKMTFWQKFAAVAKVIASGMGLVNAIKGGGKSSGSSGGGSSTAASATQAAPERVVRVDFQGDPFLTAMASSMMDQIYAASKGGRVIIAQ